MKSISVVIATYNRKDSLLETLHALENQTLLFTDFEVIVINDGSSDATESTLSAFKLATAMDFKHIKQNNKGPAAARNLGIYRAKGSIVAFTDDDCIPAVDWLAQIKRNFLDMPIIGLQGSTFTNKSEITPLTHQIDNENGNDSVPTCNAAYDRLILLELEGFDEKFPFPHNEDADLAWRVQKRGTVGFCKEMIVHHPPRVDKFWKVAKRMKILESEFRLFHKDPASYQKYRAQSPWRNIYYEIGWKTQWYYVRSRFKFWKSPILLLQGLALTLLWWWNLLFLYPNFRKSDSENKKSFGR